VRFCDIECQARQLWRRRDRIFHIDDVPAAFCKLVEMFSGNLPLEMIQLPPDGYRGLDLLHVEFGGDGVEGVVCPGGRIRITARDHRTTPEVKNGFAALVVYVDLEDRHSGGVASGFSPVLFEGDNFRRCAQGVADKDGLVKDESPVEEVSLDALRR